MITLITGRTGSGKSYKLVEIILNHLQEDRRVYTNVKLNNYDDDNYMYYDEKELKKYQLFINSLFQNVDNLEENKEKYNKSEYNGAVFVLDEIQFIGFKVKNEALFNWLTMHRHFNQEIYLATQLASVVYKDYTQLAHYWIDMINPKSRANEKNLEWRQYEGYKGEQDGGRHSQRPRAAIFEIYQTGQSETGQSFAFKQFKKFIFLFIIAVLAVIGIAWKGSEHVLGMAKHRAKAAMKSIPEEQKKIDKQCSKVYLTSSKDNYKPTNKNMTFLYRTKQHSRWEYTYRLCQ